MAQSPPSPELVEAYNLIKAGQKQDAGRILKTYLAQHKDDAQAWWLMSHAATQPETVRRCLEMVITLNPDHAKARAMLERLQAETASPEPAPPAAPVTEQQPPPAVPRTASQPVRKLPAASPSAEITGTPDQTKGRTASQPVRKLPTASPSAEITGTPDQTPVKGRTASQPARKLAPAAPVVVPSAAARPAPAPDKDDDFPDDDLVLGGMVVSSAAAPPPPPKEPPAAPPSGGASFEDYLTSAPDTDPPAGPPVDDPFAPGHQPAAASEDLFAPSNAASGSYNPFDASKAFDPAAHAKLGAAGAGTTQAAGTGNQPEWGPGLAFVADADEPVSLDDDDDFDMAHAKSRVERMLGIALIAFALMVLGGLILWYLDSSGWVSLRGDSVPSLTTMDGGSFTIKYPKKWNQRCEADISGYPVCGIANHQYYNEVDYFAGTNIDLGAMLSTSFGSLLSGGDDIPEERVSIIVMDVPRTSPSYDNGSWAKTNYEWSQGPWAFNLGAKINYDRKEVTIAGHPGYYYEYTSEGNYKEAAWDVYIEHDGVVLWLRVDYYGPREKKIPHNTVEAMIDSIQIKPVDEWTPAE